MEIVYLDPEKLKPADYNPRQMTKKQHDDLFLSLKTFGFVEPIIVNKHEGRENVVIGGHQRLSIALEMGLKSIPTVILDLDETGERELNLRLNKNNAEWNPDILSSFEPQELLRVGFEPLELSRMFDLNVDLTKDVVTKDQDGKIVCKECGRKYQSKTVAEELKTIQVDG